MSHFGKSAKSGTFKNFSSKITLKKLCQVQNKKCDFYLDFCPLWLLSHKRKSNQSYRIDLAFVMRVPRCPPCLPQQKWRGNELSPTHIFLHSIMIFGGLLILPSGFLALRGLSLSLQVIELLFERKFGNPKWPSRSEKIWRRRMLRFGGQLGLHSG